MHTFVWAETYPDLMDGTVGLSCQPVEISGRNYMLRHGAAEAIRHDPDWNNGDYTKNPSHYEYAAAGSYMTESPVRIQEEAPTMEAAKALYDKRLAQVQKGDANNTLWELESIYDYSPETSLPKIKAHVLLVNNAEDFADPPELGTVERAMQKIKYGTYVLTPYGKDTHGHFSHYYASIWKPALIKFMADSAERVVTMETFRTSDGLSLAYYVDDFTDPWREGPPLLLLHAAMGSARRYYAWVPTLARHFRTVRLDLRGHGASEIPPADGKPTLERLVADVAELLDHLGCGPAHVVGNSAGRLSRPATRDERSPSGCAACASSARPRVSRTARRRAGSRKSRRRACAAFSPRRSATGCRPMPIPASSNGFSTRRQRTIPPISAALCC